MSTSDLSSVLTPHASAQIAEPRPPSGLARFIELRGGRVFEHQGTVWAHYRGPFFSSLPYHLELDPDRRDIADMMRRFSVACVRFPTPNHRPGMPGGIYVCDPSTYSLQGISRQYRTHVKRGLDLCANRRIDADELHALGYQLNLDTMQRQNRYDPEFGDPARWRAFTRAVRDCRDVVVYGAFVEDRLSAYILGCQDGDWLHLLYKMTLSRDRALPVSHALDYYVIRDAATNPAIRTIGNSYVSVLANDGLDQYKHRMGFTVAPHNVAIHVHPAISPLVTNRIAVAVAKKVWSMNPQSPRIELAARLLEGANTTVSTHPAAVYAAAHLDACQHTGCFKYARMSRPHAMFVLRSGIRRLRNDGLGAACQKAIQFVSQKIGVKPALKPRRIPATDVTGILALQPGDLVQIKSAEEIQATLDAAGKHRGMAFVPTEMLVHCGKQYRVKKRVETIFLEESKQNRKLKNTVLLDDVQCQGIGLDCDRSCYLFWREAWLKKVETTES